MCTNMAVMAFVIWVPQDWRSREWKPSIPCLVKARVENKKQTWVVETTCVQTNFTILDLKTAKKR